MAEKQHAQQDVQHSDETAKLQSESASDNKESAPQQTAAEDISAETATAKPSQAKTKTTTPPATKKPANGVAWLGFILSLSCVAALGAGYWYWQQLQQIRVDEAQRQQNLLNEQNAKLQNLQQQLTAQLEGQNAQSLELAEQLAQRQERLAEQQRNISATLNDSVAEKLKSVDAKMAELNGYQPNDWILAEANYLIKIAERKLHLEHDKDSAKMLLSTALRQVASLQDNSLEPVMTAISFDIARIDALNYPRIDDFYLQLSGEIAKIDLMRINSGIDYPMLQSDNTAPVQPQTEQQAGWQQNFINKVTGALKKMFYFDYGAVDNELKHQFNAQEQWYLRANLRLALMQAQSAIMQRKSAIFKQALEKALLQLAQFDAKDKNVISATIAIQKMLSEPVDSEYPERFESRLLLKEFMDKRLGEQAVLLPDSEGAQQ